MMEEGSPLAIGLKMSVIKEQQEISKWWIFTGRLVNKNGRQIEIHLN